MMLQQARGRNGVRIVEPEEQLTAAMREAMSGEAQPRIEIQVPESGPPNVIETPEEAARNYATLREQDRLIRAMHGSSSEFALRTLNDYASKNSPEAQRRAQLNTLAVADAKRILATATPFFATATTLTIPSLIGRKRRT